MSKDFFKDWKKPIERSDYSNIVAVPIAIEPGKQRLFEAKDSTSLSGYSLRARVRMTFAGLPTKNKALYLPDEMYNGARSWVSPFPKPIVPRHEDESDPLGRVIDQRYVDTSNQAIILDARISSAMAPFRDSKTSKETKLKSVPIFQALATSRKNDYQGVGHIEGLWHVTDEDAIKKILDGRYLTVSTSFLPKGAYCSQCARDGSLVDWRKDYCDHEKGEIYDGYECLAIPHGFDYDHVSPVNNPAAEHARILEFGPDITFADAVSKVEYPVSHELFLDAVLVKEDKAFRLSDAIEVEVPQKLGKLADYSGENTATPKSGSVIGNTNQRENESSQGTNMKLKLSDLIKDTNSNYQEVAKFLPQDKARLTGDFLKSLEDSVFIGPNRTFPVKDKAHGEAIKALLVEVEDSDAKTDLLEVLEDKLSKFEATTANQTEEAEADAVATEETQEAEAETESDSVTVLKIDFEALTEKASKVDDLLTSRDTLKLRVESLKAEVVQLEATNATLIKDQKVFLAEQLVDAQVKQGFQISDKTEAVEKFVKRSVESLRDSLSDLAGIAETGLARNPKGGKLDHPTTEASTEDQSSTEEDPQNLAAYSAIVDKFFEISVGPGGQRAADAFLLDQKRRGYLPANIKL